MGAVIAGPNLLDEAASVVTASSVAGGLGPSYLLTPRVAEVYRSLPETERAIRAVLATVRDAGLFLIAAPADGPLCEAHARFRLTCSAVAPDGTDILDTGEVCGAMPRGRWAWPVGARVDPNRIWNPCLTDAVTGWSVGDAGTTTLQPATGRLRPPNDGAGVLRSIGGLGDTAVMDAFWPAVSLASTEAAPILAQDYTGTDFPVAQPVARTHTPTTARATFYDGTSWQEAAPGVLRTHFDPATGQRIGLMGERASTNGDQNPRAEGSTPGVLANGTLPTQWEVGTSFGTQGTTGILAEVVGEVTDAGMKGLRLRFSGTATAQVQGSVEFSPRTAASGAQRLAAVEGDIVSHAFSGRALNLPASGASFASRQLRYTSAGGIIGATDTIIGLDGTTRRVPVTFTVTTATTATVSHGIRITIASGTTCDFFVDLFWPQIEKAENCTSAILPPVGAPQVTARGAETYSGFCTRQHTPEGSSATRWNGTAWEEVPANFARLHRRFPDGGLSGQFTEGPRTNAASNPRFVGASSSTFGTGVSPSAVSSGLTFTPIGPVMEDGLPGFDFRVSGTAAVNGAGGRLQMPCDDVAIAAGGKGAYSLSYRIVSGTPMTATYMRVTSGSQQVTVPLATTTMQRQTVVYTFAAGATIMFLQFVPAFAAGPVDCVIRVLAPQFEANADTATTPILPPLYAASSSTRGAETAIQAHASISEGALFVEQAVDYVAGTGVPNRTRIRAAASSNDRADLNTSPATGGSQVQGVVAAGGTIQASITANTPQALGAFSRHALGFSTNDFSTWRDGVMQDADASGTSPTVDRVEFNGPGEAVVYRRRLRVYPRLTREQLAALTSTGFLGGAEAWEMQARLRPVGCSATVWLRWRDAAGAILAEVAGDVARDAGTEDGSKLSRLKLCRVSGLPPANAATVQGFVRATGGPARGPASVIFTRTALSRGVGKPWGRAFLRRAGDAPSSARIRYVTLRVYSAMANFQAGRLWLSPAVFTDYAPEYGAGLTMDDAGETERSATSGLRFGSPGRAFRGTGMRVSGLQPDEREAVERMIAPIGRGGQLFVAKVMERMSDEGILGGLASTPSFTETSFEQHAMDMAMQEDC